ncbi:MAG: DUF4280 domain-containing protein [Acidimicrobiales bacterium]
MGYLVVNGAACTCTFGAAPSTLVVAPANKVLATAPAANIMDHKPNTNIMPFGMCSSLSNPQVSAATSAAQGVLTPQPCVPVTSAPWAPGSPTVTIANQPALTDSSKCNCNWGGVISFTMAGQTHTTLAG